MFVKQKSSPKGFGCFWKVGMKTKYNFCQGDVVNITAKHKLKLWTSCQNNYAAVKRSKEMTNKFYMCPRVFCYLWNLSFLIMFLFLKISCERPGYYKFQISKPVSSKNSFNMFFNLLSF
jgi:hypothetical protein